MFLIGADSDINLTKDVIDFLQQKGVEVEVCTMAGVSEFVFDTENQVIHLAPLKEDFCIDWEAYRQKLMFPLMQADMLNKNPLVPARHS